MVRSHINVCYCHLIPVRGVQHPNFSSGGEAVRRRRERSIGFIGSDGNELMFPLERFRPGRSRLTNACPGHMSCSQTCDSRWKSQVSSQTSANLFV